MLRASCAVALVLLAGCASTSDDRSAPTTSQTPSASTVQTFSGCSELDFYRPVPYDTTGLGPLRPLPADPAGQTMHLLYTVMKCADLDRGSSFDADPVAIFSVLNVEPVPGKELEGAVGYQFMRTLTSDQPDLIADWAAWGVQTATSPVTLSFSDVGPNPAARAMFSVDSALHAVSGESAMAGAPNAGEGGILGLYTLDVDDVVHLHRIDFSDYQTYPNGAAVLRPGLAGAPANTVQAYHNIAYDVRFALNSTEGPAISSP